MAIDLERIAATAVGAFLRDEHASDSRSGGGSHRLGRKGAFALGVGVTIAARAAYTRARNLDLARIAGALEDKLTDGA